MTRLYSRTLDFSSIRNLESLGKPEDIFERDKKRALTECTKLAIKYLVSDEYSGEPLNLAELYSFYDKKLISYQLGWASWQGLGEKQMKCMASQNESFTNRF